MINSKNEMNLDGSKVILPIFVLLDTRLSENEKDSYLTFVNYLLNKSKEIDKNGSEFDIRVYSCGEQNKLLLHELDYQKLDNIEINKSIDLDFNKCMLNLIDDINKTKSFYKERDYNFFQPWAWVAINNELDTNLDSFKELKKLISNLRERGKMSLIFFVNESVKEEKRNIICKSIEKLLDEKRYCVGSEGIEDFIEYFLRGSGPSTNSDKELSVVVPDFFDVEL